MSACPFLSINNSPYLLYFFGISGSYINPLHSTVAFFCATISNASNKTFAKFVILLVLSFSIISLLSLIARQHFTRQLYSPWYDSNLSDLKIISTHLYMNSRFTDMNDIILSCLTLFPMLNLYCVLMCLYKY